MKPKRILYFRCLNCRKSGLFWENGHHHVKDRTAICADCNTQNIHRIMAWVDRSENGKEYTVYRKKGDLKLQNDNIIDKKVKHISRVRLFTTEGI